MSTTTPSHSGERRKSRKGLIGITAIGVAGVLVAGLGFAYFSDSLTFGGSATAGTLDLSGTLVVTQNGATQTDSTPGDTNLENFNPGDTMELSGTVTNTGSKSAWVRMGVTQGTTTAGTNIAPNLYVYAGPEAPSQATLLETDTDELDSLPGFVNTVAQLPANGASPASAANADNVAILNGTTGTALETESGGASTYDANVVVYFDKAATNTNQGEAVSLAAVVQGVQYRNNPSQDEVADWQSVISTGLNAS